MALDIEQYHGTTIISAYCGAALVREWNACAKPGNIVSLAFIAMPQILAPDCRQSKNRSVLSVNASALDLAVFGSLIQPKMGTGISRFCGFNVQLQRRVVGVRCKRLLDSTTYWSCYAPAI